MLRDTPLTAPSWEQRPGTAASPAQHVWELTPILGRKDALLGPVAPDTAAGLVLVCVMHLGLII